MIEKGTEFLPYYIQMIINYSGGIGFENYRERSDGNEKLKERNQGRYVAMFDLLHRLEIYEK